MSEGLFESPPNMTFLFRLSARIGLELTSILYASLSDLL